jgi:HAMP domain-containing protein/HPt (histidine-containing phosphotransfer) domain-containing protein
MVGLIGLLVAFLTTYFPTRHVASLKRGLEGKANAYGMFVGREIEPAIAFDDRETAREIFDAVATDGDVRALALYSERGEALYVRGELGASPLGTTLPRDGARLESFPGILRYTVPVVAKEGPRGTLVIELSTEALDHERVDLERTARLTGLAALAIGTLAAWLIARSIARRIRRIAAVTLAVAEGDLMQPSLTDSSHDEVGQLARSFNEMVRRLRDLMTQVAGERSRLDALVARRTEELDRRNQDMRLVLQHVGEGFLVVDRRGVISQERSAILDTWFGASAADPTLWDYIAKVDSGAAAWCDVAWSEVIEETLPLELTLAQMPKRITAGSTELRVRYTPIMRGGSLERVLVVFSDATADLARDAAEAAQRQTLAIFDRVMRDREGFLEFFDEAAELVSQITSPTTTERATLLRALHTLKGNCALFGLSRLAEKCHALENTMFETDAGPTEAERAELAASWRQIVETLRALVGRERGRIEVDSCELEHVRAAVLEGQPRADVAAMVSALALEPASRRVSRIADQARALAARLGKPGLRIVEEHNGVRLDAKLWAPFWSAFVHAVRNAVDHGIESPEERRAAGKVAHGTLILRTLRRGADYVIEIGDDGRGMQWHAIAARARAAGLPAETRSDLEDALFHGGISTGEMVTTVSGRGIGMEALRAACVALGGRIEITTETGRGTTLRLSIPAHPVKSRIVPADRTPSLISSPPLA